MIEALDVLHAPARRDVSGSARRSSRSDATTKDRVVGEPRERQGGPRRRAALHGRPPDERRPARTSRPPVSTADDRGRITVNEHFQTAVPHIYAAGDVIGFPALASTSMEQGRLASCHMFGASCDSRPEAIPYGIYTIPEISMVGKTEQELTQAKVPYEIGLSRFEELAKGQMLGVEAGLLKILFDPKTPEAPRRPHHRRARHRDHPHRPGGARLRRHDRLLPRHRLQLPDDGRGLQGGGPGRAEPL